MENLKKKYGLFTGIAMVVGIVIGSGIFFKADEVLKQTGGKLSMSILAWLVGGTIMIISTFCFALMASKVEKCNGVVDYVETATNKKTAYYLGWYFSTVYYPILVGTLGFVTMSYFYSLIGLESFAFTSWHFWLATILLIILSFTFNTLAPKLAGYYQVSTTIIKLIPIFFIAIVGSIYGIINGNTKIAFESIGTLNVTKDFGGAILATVFAYEGWVVATSINSELKNSKKNLPIALVVGSFIVVLCYICYYIGLSSLIPNVNDILSKGDGAPILALSKTISVAGDFMFTLLVLISCLGTLNGLTIGCSRGMYSIAYRNQGIAPEKVKKLHPKFNMPILSSLIGLAISLVYVGIWAISFTTDFKYLITMDELTISFVYPIYIFIYIWIMKNRTDLNVFNRYVMPLLAIICSLFLVFVVSGLFSVILTNEWSRVFSFLIFSLISIISLGLGYIFYKQEGNKELIE